MFYDVKLYNIFHKYKNNDFLIKEDGFVTSYFEFWIEAKEQIELLDDLEDDNFRILKAINLYYSLNGVDVKQPKSYQNYTF